MVAVYCEHAFCLGSTLSFSYNPLQAWIISCEIILLQKKLLVGNVEERLPCVRLPWIRFMQIPASSTLEILKYISKLWLYLGDHFLEIFGKNVQLLHFMKRFRPQVVWAQTYVFISKALLSESSTYALFSIE